MTSSTAPAARLSDAAARRILTAAGVTRVIVTRGLVCADSARGADVQAAALDAALDALTAAGVTATRDEDYPTWMAHLGARP